MPSAPFRGVMQKLPCAKRWQFRKEQKTIVPKSKKYCIHSLLASAHSCVEQKLATIFSKRKMRWLLVRLHVTHPFYDREASTTIDKLPCSLPLKLSLVLPVFLPISTERENDRGFTLKTGLIRSSTEEKMADGSFPTWTTLKGVWKTGNQ